MRLNSKLTWGLAWAGLAVVVAVPSADLLTGKKTAALLTSTTDPVRTAEVTTTLTPNGITIIPAASAPATAAVPTDPVNSYLKTNKTLPSYITGTASSVEPSADSQPTQVAAIDPTPAVVAPVPFPARPPDVVAPAGTSRTVTTDAVQTANLSPSSMPYVIEDNSAPTQQAALNPPAGPIPPEPIVDDSAQWHTKGLEKYLDQNGLVNDSPSRSTAQMTVVNTSDSNYDPNGFYLSDGPNNARALRRRQIIEMLNEDSPDNSDSGGFTLF